MVKGKMAAARETIGIPFKDDAGNSWLAYEGDTCYNKVKELSDAGKEVVIPKEEVLSGWTYEVKDSSWSHYNVIKETRAKLENGNFPLAKKPKTSVDDLIFPEDITTLSSQDLGKLLSKFEAWRAYVHTTLMFVDIQKKVIDDSLQIGLGKRMFEMEERGEKKKLKESIIGYIISVTPVLNKMQKDKIQLDAEYTAFDRLYQIYSGSIFAISREIARRQNDNSTFSRETGVK